MAFYTIKIRPTGIYLFIFVFDYSFTIIIFIIIYLFIRLFPGEHDLYAVTCLHNCAISLQHKCSCWTRRDVAQTLRGLPELMTAMTKDSTGKPLTTLLHSFMKHQYNIYTHTHIHIYIYIL
jgi:hypothetical protein